MNWISNEPENDQSKEASFASLSVAHHLQCGVQVWPGVIKKLSLHDPTG